MGSLDLSMVLLVFFLFSRFLASKGSLVFELLPFLLVDASFNIGSSFCTGLMIVEILTPPLSGGFFGPPPPEINGAFKKSLDEPAPLGMP